MGIPGLLPALKDFTQTDAHIHQFKGQSIAVDTSSWLHRAVYSCADVYVQAEQAGRIDPTTVNTAARYLLQRCQELIVFAQVSKIYLVLDGQHRCPLKAVTHQERTQKRALALQQALKAPNQQAAFEKYKACIHISHRFTQAVLRQVRQHSLFRDKRIALVQSPHEADAQLVQLAKAGHVQAIVTEDSDVLVYAAAAKSDVTVIYKFNRNTGACQATRMDWLWKRPEDNDAKRGRPKPATTSSSSHTAQQQIWSTLQTRERNDPGAGRRLFVQACVLTGCDYAPNELHGVGLVKAFALVTSNTYLPAEQRFLSAVRGRISPRSAVEEYVDKLKQAESVFYYHPVRTGSFFGQLAWMTDGGDPHAPAFPSHNLAILGNPDELRHLSPPGVASTETVSEAVGQDKVKCANPTEKAKGIVDDPSLSATDSSAQAKPPVPQATQPPRKRAPIVNPYQKRPLVTLQGSNVRRTCTAFNPFARFQHKTEKENANDQKTTSKSESDTIQVEKLPPSKSSDDSNNVKTETDDGSMTDTTDTSEISSPSSDTRSPFFSQSQKKVESVVSATSGAKLLPTATVKSESVATERVLPSKPSGVGKGLDFYDEWLSPKAKQDAPVMSPVDIDESTPSPGVKRPQGSMLFRLAGLVPQKNARSSKRPAQNPLAASKNKKQPKLVYRPKGVSSMITDHFRIRKPGPNS